jgi:hypothetical protein
MSAVIRSLLRRHRLAGAEDVLVTGGCRTANKCRYMWKKKASEGLWRRMSARGVSSPVSVQGGKDGRQLPASMPSVHHVLKCSVTQLHVSISACHQCIMSSNALRRSCRHIPTRTVFKVCEGASLVCL